MSTLNLPLNLSNNKRWKKFHHYWRSNRVWDIQKTVELKTSSFFKVFWKVTLVGRIVVVRRRPSEQFICNYNVQLYNYYYTSYLFATIVVNLNFLLDCQDLVVHAQRELVIRSSILRRCRCTNDDFDCVFRVLVSLFMHL